MRVLASRGSITLSVPFRKNGEYNLTVWASGSLAGKDLAKMIVGVNHVNIGEFEVDAEYPASKEYKIKFNGKAGHKNEISITFPNDFYDPKNKNPKRRDRNLYIEKIELSEPQGISQIEKSNRSHLLGEWKAEKINDEDKVFIFNDVKILIDPTSLNFLKGSKLDFVNDLIGSYFKITNPNANSTCGCGTSFSI